MHCIQHIHDNVLIMEQLPVSPPRRDTSGNICLANTLSNMSYDDMNKTFPLTDIHIYEKVFVYS